jgi:hypothetical protein
VSGVLDRSWRLGEEEEQAPRKQQHLCGCFGQPSPEPQAPSPKPQREGTKAKAAGQPAPSISNQTATGSKSMRVIPFLSFPFLSLPISPASIESRITDPLDFRNVPRPHTAKDCLGGHEEACAAAATPPTARLAYVRSSTCVLKVRGVRRPMWGRPPRLDPSRALDRFSRSTGLALQIGLLIQVLDGHQFVKPAAARALLFEGV